MKEANKAKLWTQDLLPETAEVAGDNLENAGYLVSAFLNVLAHHLSAGDAVGLRNIGTLRPTASGGLEFIPARSLIRYLRGSCK
jgi:hypothetical protein